MKTTDFLAEFCEENVPRATCRWISLSDHDPAWPQVNLGQMEKQGIIEFNADRSLYRLTLKASATRFIES